MRLRAKLMAVMGYSAPASDSPSELWAPSLQVTEPWHDRPASDSPVLGAVMGAAQDDELVLVVSSAFGAKHDVVDHHTNGTSR